MSWRARVRLSRASSSGPKRRCSGLWTPFAPRSNSRQPASLMKKPWRLHSAKCSPLRIACWQDLFVDERCALAMVSNVVSATIGFSV